MIRTSVLEKRALIHVGLAEFSNKAEDAIAGRGLGVGIIRIINTNTTVLAGRRGNNTPVDDLAAGARVTSRALALGSEVATTKIDVQAGTIIQARVVLAGRRDFAGKTGEGTETSASNRGTAWGTSGTVEARVVRRASGNKTITKRTIEVRGASASEGGFGEGNKRVDAASSMKAGAWVARIWLASTESIAVAGRRQHSITRRGGGNTNWASQGVEVSAILVVGDQRISDIATSKHVITRVVGGNVGGESGQATGRQSVLGCRVARHTTRNTLLGAASRGSRGLEIHLLGRSSTLCQSQIDSGIEKSAGVCIALLDQDLESDGSSANRGSTEVEKGMEGLDTGSSMGQTTLASISVGPRRPE